MTNKYYIKTDDGYYKAKDIEGSTPDYGQAIFFDSYEEAQDAADKHYVNLIDYFSKRGKIEIGEQLASKIKIIKQSDLPYHPGFMKLIDYLTYQGYSKPQIVALVSEALQELMGELK